MNYDENFCGIHFKAKRGEVLMIEADAESFSLSQWDGVLNVMSKDCCGRTAVFADDCRFFSAGDKRIYVEILPGTPSYMKELAKIRPLSKHEFETHRIGKLW